MSGLTKAVNNLFHNRSLRRTLLTYRLFLAVTAIALILYYAKSDFFYAAFATSMFGEFIQLWCFASLDKQKELASNGLYKHIRNPMYLGRFFIVLGYFLLLGNIYAVIPFTIIYYLYMWHRVEREEEQLKKVFGQPYQEYCEQVNRFIPSFKGMPGGKFWFWEWRLFYQNHGPANLSAVLLSYAAAYIWFFVIQTG